MRDHAYRCIIGQFQILWMEHTSSSACGVRAIDAGGDEQPKRKEMSAEYGRLGVAHWMVERQSPKKLLSERLSQTPCVGTLETAVRAGTGKLAPWLVRKLGGMDGGYLYCRMQG